MKDKIVVLVGATATGKSEIAVNLAKKLNGEIISADSMQIYEGMDIGTAKITLEESQGIPHYLIDEIKPDEQFSVAMFKDRCFAIIKDIFNRGKLPLIVGGTGLYINSVVQPWNFSRSEPDFELRKQLEEKSLSPGGKEHLYDQLVEIDLESAKKIHPNNVKRVIRALEVYHLTGKSKSYWDKKSMDDELKYNPVMIGLDMERNILYERIEQRIDRMIESGLVDEVETLLNEGYDESLISMQGLGYKEIIRYIKGVYTLEEAVEILKRDTRHFAKRQLTWFRRDERIKWFSVGENIPIDNVIKDILFYIYNKGINE